MEHNGEDSFLLRLGTWVIRYLLRELIKNEYRLQMYTNEHFMQLSTRLIQIDQPLVHTRFAILPSHPILSPVLLNFKFWFRNIFTLKTKPICLRISLF